MNLSTEIAPWRELGRPDDNPNGAMMNRRTFCRHLLAVSSAVAVADPGHAEERAVARRTRTPGVDILSPPDWV
jgi:hypothetical protein